MIEVEHIEAIRDSVASVLPLLRVLTENSSPEPYTVENLWWTKLNVAISITAALIGGLGAYYGYKGFVYAKETARNVAPTTRDTSQVMFVITSGFIAELCASHCNILQSQKRV